MPARKSFRQNDGGTVPHMVRSSLRQRAISAHRRIADEHRDNQGNREAQHRLLRRESALGKYSATRWPAQRSGGLLSKYG
jgi:hypothetical protein